MLPSAMLKRLAAFQRQNQLDFALQELGRIERTLFMLDWLESAQLRQLCNAGLNKSEQRHALAQVICTFKAGAYRRPRSGRAAVPRLRAEPDDRGGTRLSAACGDLLRGGPGVARIGTDAGAAATRRLWDAT